MIQILQARFCMEQMQHSFSPDSGEALYRKRAQGREGMLRANHHPARHSSRHHSGGLRGVVVVRHETPPAPWYRPLNVERRGPVSGFWFTVIHDVQVGPG